MKAALWYGKRDVRLENIKEPSLKPGTVKVKVYWCGICGTDLHEFEEGPIFIPTDHHPLTGEKFPVVLGHEFSGMVVEVSDGVTKVKVGDKVTIEPIIACGECPQCLEGKYNICSKLGFQGLAGEGGGLSEYCVTSERFVHKIPDDMSLEMAALVEPYSVGVHALKQANFLIGQSAVVLGAGTIGLATIEVLKAAGASKIFVVQRKSVRQEYAKNLGADYIFDPNEVNVEEEIKKLTNGVGADVSFDTTSSQVGFSIGLNSIRYDGTLVVISISTQDVSFNPNVLVFSEKKVIGILAYNGTDFATTIALMASGRIKAEGFVTKKIPLDSLLEDGFGTLTGPDKKKHVKILVTPDQSLI